MSIKERVREHRSDVPSEEELRTRSAEGWKLVAVEWERQAGAGEEEPAARRREVPYGLRPSDDGLFLEDDRGEVAILRSVLRGMVDDRSLSEIAGDLNAQGSRTRQNRPWSQSDLFDLLPRIVEAGADILRSEEWAQERRLRAI